MTTATPEFAIETHDLCKTYPQRRRQEAVTALAGVSLQVPVGAFFGLLGPNGAGKSTLINILAGLVVRSSGAARIWGCDIERDMRAARRAIGVVPQELNFDPFFTPRELLELQAGLYGVPKAQAADRRDPRRGRPQPAGQRLLAQPVGRHAAPAAGGQGDGARAAGAGPRRAVGRRRRRTAPPPLGLRPGAEPRRHHHPADHPLPRRGAGAVRPDRHHRPRPDDRLRHHRGAAAPDRLQDDDGDGARSADGGAAGPGARFARAAPRHRGASASSMRRPRCTAATSWRRSAPPV